MANKHVNKCSRLLTIREMKITMRYYFTATKMAVIKKGIEYKELLRV